ncbi:hypothetical protein K9N50_03600 [bacterium]|nr:hypothetical protein [bacterium]
MRYTIITVLSIFALMAAGAANNLTAQDWSDEVRMTYFGEGGMSKFFSVKDSDDNLHFLYTIYKWGEDERGQAIYQKFNRIGEPLTDPIQVSEVTNVPDTTEAGTRAVDLFISSDNVVHIMSCTRHADTNYRFYYSRLDIDGNAIADAVLLEGLGDIPYYPNDQPYNIVVDSRENVIIGGCSFHFFGDTTRSCRVFYQKFNFNGEPVDEMRFIDQRGTERSNSMKITSNDTLVFVWTENHESINYVYYCKVTLDDSVIVDNFSVIADDGWGSVSYSDFELDSKNRLVILLWDAYSNLFIRKYNNNMERQFQVAIGEYYNRRGDIYIDSQGNIHVAIGLEPIEGRRYIGYSKIDFEGNLLDSAIVIYDGENQQRIYWTQVKTFACDDGFTGVFWSDERWGPYEEEIILRYRQSQHIDFENDLNIFPENLIINSIYPNPFNSSTCIMFTLPYMSIAEFEILDICGRNVYNQRIYSIVGGNKSYIWNGTNNNGIPLPSGNYCIRLKCGNSQLVGNVVLMR